MLHGILNINQLSSCQRFIYICTFYFKISTKVSI